MDDIEIKATEVAHILKLLSHPKRFLILCKLREGPKTVGDLEKYCTIGQSQLSQFLIKMREEGVLDSEKNGQHVSYSIKDSRIHELINQIQKTFCK
ncbi:winged helix-turn-helix transcriptional regulator [Candidatus Gracilibacteria bacterium]|nr:winged helix-turn-helix transcriptional regulator [Candidatus Gracilibacteria bacterium]